MPRRVEVQYWYIDENKTPDGRPGWFMVRVARDGTETWAERGTPVQSRKWEPLALRIGDKTVELPLRRLGRMLWSKSATEYESWRKREKARFDVDWKRLSRQLHIEANRQWRRGY